MANPNDDASVKRMKGDFCLFMQYAWKLLGLPQPTWIQNSIARYLQHGENKRRGVLGFRGVAKSTITRLYGIWRLWNNPDCKVLIVSASADLAVEATTFMLMLLDLLPVVRHLKPDEEAGQRFSRIAFDVAPAKPAGAPSVKARGISSQITGSRADLIIPDDIEVSNNSLTQAMRDKISHGVKEFDAILKPGGEIIYLGTPQTQHTIYRTLMQRGYTFRVWPVMFPREDQVPYYSGMLSPDIVEAVERSPGLAGKPTDPKRFNDREIAERLLSFGPIEFARQFMLDTRMSDAQMYPLRLADLIVADLNVDVALERYVWASGPENVMPEVAHVGLEGDRLHRPMSWVDADGRPPRALPYQGRVMAVDPAGRGKDETAYAVCYMLHGMIFLMETGGLRGGYNEQNLETLAQVAKKHRVNQLVVESNFGDGMFLALLIPYLKRVWPVSTEEIRNTVQKERRILDILEPVIHQHRLVVNRQVLVDDIKSTTDYLDEDAHVYQLFFQMTRLTRDRGCLKQDDRIDAVAMAVNHFVTQLSKEVGQAADESREALRNQAIQDFLDRSDRSRGSNTTFRDNWMGANEPTAVLR